MRVVRLCFLCVIVLSFCNGYNTQKLNETHRNRTSRYYFRGIRSKAFLAKLSKMKFILVWTRYEIPWPLSITNGHKVFKDKNCPIKNCFITSDRRLFFNITEFDVIAFHGPQVVGKKLPEIKHRSPNQKYVFVSVESSDNYPICSNKFNNYFNWTWTYKINSHLYFGYIVIRDKNNKIIGPRKIMNWMKIEDMQSINNTLKDKLSHKNIAAAWFVSNCVTVSRRERFVDKVRKEMAKNGLTLDIYGVCGNKYCSKNTRNVCYKKIERDYYFYFAFENSFSEDYVTEKLLSALQHYAVPVVFGAANYSRFMPNGIYLHALKLGVKDLVKQMVELINDKEKYYNYFKWHNHYSYHSLYASSRSDYFCKMCELVNKERAMARKTVVRNFQAWWTSIRFRRQSCSTNLIGRFS